MASSPRRGWVVGVAVALSVGVLVGLVLAIGGVSLSTAWITGLSTFGGGLAITVIIRLLEKRDLSGKFELPDLGNDGFDSGDARIGDFGF